MIVIPAIDILNNKAVRLYKGNFNEVTVYNNSPLEQAVEFHDAGFKRIHVVDLAGSRDGKLNILPWIEKIKLKTGMEIECGGGIRTLAQAKQLITAGADYLIIGSISITDSIEFESIVKEVTPACIIIASDIKENKIAIKGWEVLSGISVEQHINENIQHGIKQYLCTDISKDGALTGSNFELYSRLTGEYPESRFIASGGLKDKNDLKELRKMNMYAAIVGKAFYEKKISLKEMLEYDN